MTATVMPSVKILLDLTLVPAKRVLQEMERHALVRFLSFWLVHNYSDLPFFQQHKNKMCLIIYKLSSSNDGSAPSCLVPIVDSFFSSSSFRSCKSFVRVSSLLFKPSAQKSYACYLKRTLSRYIMNFSCTFSILPLIK